MMTLPLRPQGGNTSYGGELEVAVIVLVVAIFVADLCWYDNSGETPRWPMWVPKSLCGLTLEEFWNIIIECNRGYPD